MHALENKIRQLEKVQAQQMAELKNSAIGIVESFTPSHMIKSVLTDVAHTPGLRTTAINTAIGIGAGFVGKKMFVGNSGSIFKKITGSAIQFIIANWVRKKMPGKQINHIEHQ